MICRRARLGAPETPAAADALRCTANYLLQPSQTQLRCSKQPASERKRPVLCHTCSSRSRKPQSCHEPTRQVERAIIAHQSEAPDCHHPSRHLEGVVFQSGWKILPYATPCSRRKGAKGLELSGHAACRGRRCLEYPLKSHMRKVEPNFDIEKLPPSQPEPKAAVLGSTTALGLFASIQQKATLLF